MNINHLSISWSVSRGQDTYGYNICRLDSYNTGKRYRCIGGGYDMIGTVFGDWLEDEYQERLHKFFATQEKTEGYSNVKNFYGARIRDDGSVSLDGACGIDCMIRIAEAIGIEVEREYKSKGRNRGETTGWFVSEKE